MKLNKKELIRVLELVKPGLSNKDIVEQANNFGFTGDGIVTYNDQISVYHAFLTDFVGAVPADGFHSFLRKSKMDKDGNIEIVQQDDNLVIKAGKRSKATLVMNTEMRLPLDEVAAYQEIDDWVALPGDFFEGLKIALTCTSCDMSKPALTCVSIQGDKLISCDNQRIIEYSMNSDMGVDVLVPGTCLRGIWNYELVEFAVTDGWIHFRDGNEVVYSCRRYDKKFPNVEPLLNITGQEIKFTKKLIPTLERALPICKQEIKVDEVVSIELKGKYITVKAAGDVGKFTESLPMKGIKNEIEFAINPTFLIDILNTLKQCQLNKTKGLMLFESEKWKHAISVRK